MDGKKYDIQTNRDEPKGVSLRERISLNTREG